VQCSAVQVDARHRRGGWWRRRVRRPRCLIYISLQCSAVQCSAVQWLDLGGSCVARRRRPGGGTGRGDRGPPPATPSGAASSRCWCRIVLVMVLDCGCWCTVALLSRMQQQQDIQPRGTTSGPTPQLLDVKDILQVE
jgi:hypothetical protein